MPSYLYHWQVPDLKTSHSDLAHSATVGALLHFVHACFWQIVQHSSLYPKTLAANECADTVHDLHLGHHD